MRNEIITPDRAKRAEIQYNRLLHILSLGFLKIREGHRIKKINPEGVEKEVPLTDGQRFNREMEAGYLERKYNLGSK